MDFSKPETIRLDDLQKRIVSTDLVPSRVGLLEGIEGVFKKVEDQGIHTWLDLQKAIKNPKHIEEFSAKTGIDLQYLVLLRREVEGYFPKPFDLKELDWVAQEVINKLQEKGISTSDIFFKRFGDKNLAVLFADQNGIDPQEMVYLLNLISLCRVQWVSPTTARMLIEASYDNCQKLANANAKELFDGMVRVNLNGIYFKGTIGLRDIQRLIDAAQYEV